MRCRHNKTWLVSGGLLEWCYECGAIRQMRRVKNANAVTPDSKWAKPTGKGGDNPWKAWGADG
jgi:hypothetical protein